MKKKKIKLEDLKVQSFSTFTHLSKDETKQLAGGGDTDVYTCHHTLGGEVGCHTVTENPNSVDCCVGTAPGTHYGCNGGGSGTCPPYTQYGGCPTYGCPPNTSDGCYTYDGCSPDTSPNYC